MKRAALLTALFCFGAVGAGAQSPLARPISLHARDVALRDALDRIAILGGVRLSYSGAFVPLDRRVTVDRDASPLLDVLAALLRPFAVEPVAVSDDHIVLTPRRQVERDSIVSQIPVLERVVVTGSVLAASERPLPIALDVIPGRDVERREESTLSRVFSGSVPGVWLWEQTPTTMLARYGSVRGASSFGLTFPKVYIDGIEVANPLLLTEISPELVERVEVIRGPQGAALYGSDAISGVVNIVSRHEGTGADGSHALIRSTIGSSATIFGPDVAVQNHAVSWRGGSNLRSGGITVGGSTTGQYVPQAYTRELRAIADGRWVSSRSTLTANTRFFAKNAGIPANPLLAGLNDDELETDDDPQQLRMYSAGATYRMAHTERWTYAVTAGLDGYRLSNVSNEQGPVPSVADTALRAASGSANRGTLRASAVTHVGTPERVGATFTLGAESSVLWDHTRREFDPDNSGSGSSDDDFARGQASNTGFLAQTIITLRNAAFVTAGLRREHIVQTQGLSQVALLPMAGLSLVKEFASFAVKWRAAYGKGIRAPRSSLHLATSEPRNTVANRSLMPEEQSGIETGVDVRLGRILGVHVTRFDQQVSGLIQAVTVSNLIIGGSGPSQSSWYQLQNVGEISNRGWETQLSLLSGPLQLSGAATFVDSRVRRLTAGYTGDMAAGDRMLAVPARTVSGTASWVRRGYHVSATISRASDWINYDRLAIARALIADSLDSEDLTGTQLRQFWTSYPGTTRLRASVSRDLWRGLSVGLTGENLLGYQRGEPDTITIVPGRTISLGVRARF